jgi:hypothetical protein
VAATEYRRRRYIRRGGPPVAALTALAVTSTSSTLPISTTTTPASTSTTAARSGDTALKISPLDQAEQYTACTRSHGVTDFPEPTVVDGQITFAGTPGLGRTAAFSLAQQTCSLLIYGASPVQGGGGE